MAGVLGLLAGAGPARSAGPEIVTSSGHRIVSVDPSSGRVSTLHRPDPGERFSITSVSTSVRAPVVAYSVVVRERLGEGRSRLRDQIWLIRKDGSKPRMLREWVRVLKGRSNVISPRPNGRGAHTGIREVVLSPDGKRMLVTKPFPFVSFELTIGQRGWRFVNPDDCGLASPEYDATGTRVVALFNCPPRYGVGIMSLRTKRPRILLENDRIDFLAGTPSMSPDGKLIAFTAEKSLGPDPHPRAVSAEGVYLMDRDGGNAKILKGTKESPLSFEQPKFSPDGKQLAMLVTNRVIPSDGSRVFVIRKTGRGLRQVFRGRTSWWDHNPQWLP